MNTRVKKSESGFLKDIFESLKRTHIQFVVILLLFLFSAPSVYAQTIENYEGTPITMTMMKGGAADLSMLTVVANPSATGINTSAKVCRLLRDKDGVPWEGFWSNKTVDVTTNKYVHVKVYKTRISTLKFKLEGGTAGTLEIASKYTQTKVNQWEDIVFDFSSKTGTYPIIAFMPDFSDPVNLGADITLYFDDIIVNNSPTPITIVANYTIAGNAGVAAATLTYTGGTAPSDASGNYSLTVASGWSGTVTPSKAGYTFTPANRTYTNVVANQTAQNFTASQNPVVPDVPGTLQTESYTAMAGIQTEATTDAGGGLNVGWIDPGDWMEYSINVPSSGTYTISYRVASFAGGGSVALRENGVVRSTTTLPTTGGWQTWTTVNTTVSLTAGIRTIRLTAVTGGWNMNWWSVATSSNYTIAGNAGVAAATLSYTGGTATSDASGNYSVTVASGWSGSVTPSKAGYTFTPANRTYTNVVANQTAQNFTAAQNPVVPDVPGTLQAESYTAVAGIQTEATTDAGGGLNVGWIDPGDWMEYSINVPSSGTYTISYRVASFAGGGSVALRENGVVRSTTTLPTTGGWQTWTTVNTTVSLTAGIRTIRLTAVTGGWNMNWWSVATSSNYTIAGNAGVAAATLTYTGGTATSDASGNYSITVASGWSGTVTPLKAGYTFTPANRTYTNVVSNQTAQNYTATTGTEDPTITAIFQSSYKLYKDTRLANGNYLDALAINAGNKPASIVGCGIGLVSLAIADAMYQKTGDAANWENNAAAMATQTMQTLIGFKNNGKTNGAGLFHRYFDQNTGDLTGTWTGEYSTADNAIFAFGLIICKNYFSGNTTLVNAANTLLSAMDYTKAIYTTNIAMVLDQSGNVGSAFTIPWNEYIMVAWLAKNANPSNPGYAKSQTFWNTYFANPRTSPCNHPTYSGYELLSDAGFCSSFTAQFPYYYVNYFKNNADYMWYFNNWRNADWTFQGGATYEWGLGAGEVPGGGYSADRINDNPNNIVSPHIIAGFIPIYAQSKADLLSLYNNGSGPAVYSLPSNGAKKVLWRYSRNNTALRTPYIQSVDFSTMLYGLASLPEYLGPNWFTSYNMPSNLKSESLIDVEKHTSLAVYPNPVSDFLHVDLKENSSAIVDIYALDGRLINNVKLENRNNTIDVRQLKRTGVVIVQVNSGSEISTHRVMIK